MNHDSRQRLHDEIVRIVSHASATVGVCAIHLESGTRVDLDSFRSFPLASTYKIPIAIRLLTLVQQGDLSLDQMFTISAEDLSPGSGPIKELFSIPGVQLSLQNLLDLAMRFSDNTASDIVLRLAGGAHEVTTMLGSKGLAEIRIDRSTKEILCDYYGLGDLASEQPWSLERFRTRLRETSKAQRKAGIEAFQKDPRDHGTPAALVSLLSGLQKGDWLNPEYAAILLNVMRTCHTGAGRLKGQLPAGTIVAHKTGSLEGLVANDAGIIDLPDGHGHIAIAVMAESTKTREPELELTIARIARAIYDALLFASD